MNRKIAIVAAVAALLWIGCSSRPVNSQEKAPSRSRAILTKPYTPQLGDMVALTTAQFLTGLETINAPMLAYYDRDARGSGRDLRKAENNGFAVGPSHFGEVTSLQ